MLIKPLFFGFLALNYCVNGAKILGVFPFPGVSHYILGYKLMKGLAEAGHDITMIAPFKLEDAPKNGSYTEVFLEGFKEDFEALTKNMNFFENKAGTIGTLKVMSSMFFSSANNTLHHPNVKKLLQSNTKFDVVIMEQFNNDALKVFSYIYDCPLVVLSAIGPGGWTNALVGNPQPVATEPFLMNNDFSKEFSFLFRAKNLMFCIGYYLFTTWFLLPKHDEIMHQVFPDAPPLYNLYTNVSLILLNSHASMSPAVPMVPSMIEVGGYFIDPPKKLPRDLQDFLDGAEEGVIYFSMGSALKSKNIPEEKKKRILNVLGRLKQRVLWKFEEDLPGKPDNMMIRKWLPQQDVLAHPNIKLFITHGGLLSTTETVYHGVPILAIPVFADQPANAARAAAGGYGLVLDYQDQDFTEERLGSLVNELLTNPKYRENIQRRSKVYHDRTQKPMETAVYWVEYVIRHNGAPHLRVAGVRMPWYKYFMVDVIGVLIISIVTVLYIIKLLFTKMCCKGGNEPKKIKTN